MVTTTVTFTDRVSKMSSKLQAALMLPSSTDARSVGLQITAASNGHSSMDPKL
jgi:threonine aldolase